MSALAGIHAATRYRSNHQKDWRIKNSVTDRSAVIIRKDHCTDRGNEEKTVELRGGQVGRSREVWESYSGSTGSVWRIG